MAVLGSDTSIQLAAQASRFGVATVFLLAGVAKLPRRPEFERAVLNYELLPYSAARLVGRWLPVAEVTVAALLAVGVAIVPVASFVAILLAIFIVAVTVNLLRKKQMDCGCFANSGAPRQMTWWVVARNALLLAAALLVVTSPSGTLALWPGWATHGSDAVTSRDAVAMLVAGSLAILAALVVQESLRVRKVATFVGEMLA